MVMVGDGADGDGGWVWINLLGQTTDESCVRWFMVLVDRLKMCCCSAMCSVPAWKRPEVPSWNHGAPCEDRRPVVISKLMESSGSINDV